MLSLAFSLLALLIGFGRHLFSIAPNLLVWSDFSVLLAQQLANLVN